VPASRQQRVGRLTAHLEQTEREPPESHVKP
jgi:hypothetical protein